MTTVSCEVEHCPTPSLSHIFHDDIVSYEVEHCPTPSLSHIFHNDIVSCEVEHWGRIQTYCMMT